MVILLFQPQGRSDTVLAALLWQDRPPGTLFQHLTDELCQVADVEARQRLRSSSSSSLIVSRTRLLTVGDRAFPVAAARVWNSLPDLVTPAPSVAVFRSRLKTHLFNIPTPVIVQCLRSDSSCFGHYNRSSLLTSTQRPSYIVVPS